MRFLLLVLHVVLLFAVASCDGAVNLVVENRRSSGVEVIVDGDRNWGWVDECTAYDFGVATTSPGNHPMQVTARDEAGRVVHDETVTVDLSGTDVPTVSVSVPEQSPSECQTIKQSRYPTPHPRPTARKP